MARKKLDEVQPIEITLAHNVLVTSSHQVAKHFGKSHDNVLRDIRNIIGKAPKDWAAINFEDMSIDVEIGNGAIRKDPAFLMTRDGFSILAMGFTGEKALQWKIQFIEAFNAMEKTLVNQLQEGHSLTEKQLAGLKNDRKALGDLRAFLKKHIDAENLTLSPKYIDNSSKYDFGDKIIQGLILYWSYLDNINPEIAAAIVSEYTRTQPDSVDSLNYRFNFIQKMIHKPLKAGDKKATQQQIEVLQGLAEAADHLPWVAYSNHLEAFLTLYDGNVGDLNELSFEGAQRYIQLMYAHFMAAVSYHNGRYSIHDLCEQALQKLSSGGRHGDQ